MFDYLKTIVATFAASMMRMGGLGACDVLGVPRNHLDPRLEGRYQPTLAVDDSRNAADSKDQPGGLLEPGPYLKQAEIDCVEI